MAQIEIKNPLINRSIPDWLENSPWILQGALAILNNAGVDSLSHPRLIELCAGNGLASAAFHAAGWSEITCVDQYLPTFPRVQAKWLHWDLNVLSQKLQNQIPLPDKVNLHREQYDLVIALGDIGELQEKPDLKMIVNFLCSKNGIGLLPSFELIRQTD